MLIDKRAALVFLECTSLHRRALKRGIKLYVIVGLIYIGVRTTSGKTLPLRSVSPPATRWEQEQSGVVMLCVQSRKVIVSR